MPRYRDVKRKVCHEKDLSEKNMSQERGDMRRKCQDKGMPRAKNVEKKWKQKHWQHLTTERIKNTKNKGKNVTLQRCREIVFQRQSVFYTNHWTYTQFPIAYRCWSLNLPPQVCGHSTFCGRINEIREFHPGTWPKEAVPRPYTIGNLLYSMIWSDLKVWQKRTGFYSVPTDSVRVWCWSQGLAEINRIAVA